MSQQRTYYSEEAKENARIKITAIVAICLAVGALIGTAIAALFMPQTGEETREQLGEAGESALDRLQQQVDDLRKRLEDFSS
ncbi:MAG: YtxH domain-containing protein [Anaerolineae bacterium]